MTTSAHRRALAFLLSLIGLFPALRAPAASLSLVVTPSTHSAVPDASYPGSGSIVAHASDKQSGLTFAIAGRNYGVNPSPGQDRWGLRTGQLPGNSGQATYLVTNGFTPAAAGSKTDHSGNAASYISFQVGNVPAGTLFQNLSIDFNGLTFTRTTNAWAATSISGFNSWTAANQTNNGPNGRQISVSLPDFTWTGGPPLEIRLYGITGADEGAFANIQLNANILPAPVVPEPSTSLLALLAAAWHLRRRRR